MLADSTPPSDESIKSLSDRIGYFRTLARAHHLRGDRARAVAALEQAIAAQTAYIRRLRADKREAWYIEEQEAGLERLRKLLADYKAE